MDRIIEIKVNGNYLTKDNKNAGVRGEGNATKLRITFDEGWQGYGKSITFWDAHGENPKVIMLGTTYLENWVEKGNTYIVPIPKEPMAKAGMLTFIIDGYIEKKDEEGNVIETVWQRSLSDKLEVKDAPIADNATKPEDPELTVAEHLQQQIDGMLGEVQDMASNAYGFRVDAEGFADNARASEGNAKTSENNAQEWANLAEQSSANALGSADRAWDALGHINVVGANGNWLVWDSSINGYKDTGVKAQGDSGVYLGANPPESAKVWIDPNGNAVIYATADDVKAVRHLLYDVANKVASTLTTVTVYANKWKLSPTHNDRWYQVVTITDVAITDKSKVNVYPNGDMLDEMYERLVSVYAEQENGVVKVYCKGRPLLNTYTMQVSVKEVEVNEQ